MTRAVAYARVSTLAQGEEEKASIPEQTARIEEYCQGKGYELIDRYIDIGYSGSKSKRPEFQRMLEDARQQKFEVIVAWKADRLSRGMYPAAALMEVIEPLDIKLEAVEELLDMNTFSIYAIVGKMELDNIKARTLMGKRAGAKAGKLSTGGARLFGYDVLGGKRVIRDDEAEIIRGIFRKFAYEGYTLYRATLELNKDGIEAPRGSKWSEQTISRILNNPSYKGDAHVFRYKVIEPRNPKKELRRYTKTTHILRDKSEWIEVPGASPPIVSREVYEAAQAQLQLNRERSPRNLKHQYLLSRGKLRCGICGHSMVGSCKKKPAGDWLFYRCVKNVKTNYYEHCSQHSIAANTIEAAVWSEVSRALKDPSLILQEMERMKKDTIPTTLEAEEILVENNIKRAQEEEQRYLRKYGQGLFTDEQLDVEVRRVRRYRETEEARLVKLQGQRKAILENDIRFENISGMLAQVAGRVDEADFNLKRLALDALSVTITLNADKQINILGYIPSEGELTLTNSPPCTMAPPGMTPPCWKR